MSFYRSGADWPEIVCAEDTPMVPGKQSRSPDRDNVELLDRQWHRVARNRQACDRTGQAPHDLKMSKISVSEAGAS
jgi:hypothetical protein